MTIRRRKAPVRILILSLALLCQLTSVSFAASTPSRLSATPAIRVTVDTVRDVFVQDTFAYPEVFRYLPESDPNDVMNVLYENQYHNLMLVFAAEGLHFDWIRTPEGKLILEVTPTYYDTAGQRKEVRNYVNLTADALFRSDMSDLDRLQAVNRHLVEQFEYDQSNTVYSVYPFITNGSGVCQSYAQLGLMLLLAGGMNAYPVTGKADGVAHSWIAAEVDGIWYEFDPTFNDSLGYQDASTRVAYLMRSREDMLKEGRVYDPFLPDTYIWEDGLRQTLVSTDTTAAEPSIIPDNGASTAFSDIQPGQWFYDSAVQINQTGLMIGSGGRFLPDGTVTLAQVVTVAARLHASRNNQQDVLEDLLAAANNSRNPWYVGYVDYVESMGLFQGSEFGPTWPERKATRQEMAYILQKTVGSLTPLRSVSIPDIGLVKPPYVLPVRMMANSGIITGTDTRGTFSPDGIATRAQLAVMLVRLLNAS